MCGTTNIPKPPPTLKTVWQGTYNGTTYRLRRYDGLYDVSWHVLSRWEDGVWKTDNQYAGIVTMIANDLAKKCDAFRNLPAVEEDEGWYDDWM